MNFRIWSVFAILIVGQLSLSAAPKFAVVRVTDIYTTLPQVKEAQEKAERAKEEVLLDPRAEELRSGLDTLKQIQSKIAALSQRALNDEARKLAKEFEVKRIETKALQEDFERFRNERELEINREMVTEMRTMLNKISELSQKTAREKGFQLVIDSSGATSTGIPMVLYVKDAPDITDEIIAILEAERKAAEEAAAPETSEESTIPAPEDSSTPTPEGATETPE